MEFLLSDSSSSSSSDTDDDLMPRLVPFMLRSHPKNENYIENTVSLYSDVEFREHFRVSRKLVERLAEKLQNSDYYPSMDTGHKRIPAWNCMLIFLWFAGHEAADFRDVGDRFDVTISKLHNIIQTVSLCLSNMASSVITWPSLEEKQQVIADFTNLGFPNVIGCIDGTHIQIDKPATDHESYINRKKFYSIQMQSVCDSNRKLTDIFIGYPGSVHDARVFRNSPLHHTLQEKCGTEIILADSAYPCLRHMLTPYRDNGNVTPVERNFNKKLSECRITIEHTFGMLKQRFRQLYHLKLRKIDDICHFIRACCVLHNMALFDGFEIDPEDTAILDFNEDQPDDNEPADAAGQHFINYIAALLYYNN
ncbi:unnamed protein product [Callosobruchus maculatus]|uniref:DDE Tnp4 domain-containing protein n=1 Tax=Callosobruchus maculatus TaxID=64391 RepID=A0A653D8D5_CALMS|nr:unnamed protein product [Callosobruchus maculatus]